jgi:peroxiredoxin
MKHFDTIIYVVFLIVICLLAWKIADLKSKLGFTHEEPPNQDCQLYTEFFGKVIPAFSLQGLDGKPYSAFGNSPFYLIIFFTPWDCQSCFDEVAFWEELRDRFRGSIEVVAIGTANSIELLRYFVEKNRITIYTIYDEKEELFKAVELRDLGLTPMKFLTNSSGTILNASMSTHRDEAEQRRYLELLTRIVM